MDTAVRYVKFYLPGCPPLAERIADRLAAMLIDADCVLAELQTEEANTLLWIEPRVQRVYDQVDEVLSRLAH